MRKTIALLVAALVTIAATAANRLYLPDFTICPGETVLVALILENDEQFTAFQTDLILPEGITVVQEDDEYLFELSGRKASDHTIVSKMREDGALRMVSFSIGVKPYSGNNGALVIIPFTAADDFTGPATIKLKNSRLANLEGEEFVLAGESSHVIQLEEQILGDVNGDGAVNVTDVTQLISYVANGCTSSVHIENADLINDGNINVSDVTSLINRIIQSK